MAVVSIAVSALVAVKIYARRIEGNVLAKMEDSFSKASLEAITKNSDQFLKWAKELLSQETQANARELSGKKEMIDNTLQQMKLEMNKVQDMITSFEKDREQKFGAISKGLENHSPADCETSGSHPKSEPDSLRFPSAGSLGTENCR